MSFDGCKWKHRRIKGNHTPLVYHKVLSAWFDQPAHPPTCWAISLAQEAVPSCLLGFLTEFSTSSCNFSSLSSDTELFSFVLLFVADLSREMFWQDELLRLEFFRTLIHSLALWV